MCFFYRLFLKYLLNIPSQQNDLYLNPLSLIKSYTINPANMHTNSYFFFSRMIEDWYWCSQQLYCSTSFQTQSVRNSGRCCQVLLLLFFWFGVRLSSISKARASFISLVDVRFGDACRAGVDRTCVCNEVVYKNLSATVCVCVWVALALKEFKNVVRILWNYSHCVLFWRKILGNIQSEVNRSCFSFMWKFSSGSW